MMKPEINALIAAQVRVVKKIVVALSLGCGSYLGWVLLEGPLEKPPATPVLTYAAIGLAVVMGGMRFVIPGIVVESSRRQLAKSMVNSGESVGGEISPNACRQLLGLFQTKTILAGAMLEGAAFVAIYAYAMEGTLISLMLGAALLLGVALHFPLPSAVADWIEVQWQRMKQDHLLG